jgi:hypothetical protein
VGYLERPSTTEEVHHYRPCFGKQNIRAPNVAWEILFRHSARRGKGPAGAGQGNGHRFACLARILPPDFYLLKYSDGPAPALVLRTVTNNSGQWIVALDGPNGDSAVVTLNDKYEVINAKVVPRIP